MTPTMEEKNLEILKVRISSLRISALVGILGAISFLILSVLNMFLYPGSFHIAYNVFPYPHYSFIYNNLSDMGMLNTFTGESNYISAAIFTFTLTITGLSFFVYVRNFPKVFDYGTKSYKISRIGSILGMISSLAFVGIGWTPWDVAIIPHMLFVFIGFLLSIVFNIYFAIAILNDAEYPNWFALTLIFYTLMIVGYILALILGPPYGSLMGRVVESLGQKIVVYTQMVLLIINAIGLLWVIRKKIK